MKTGYAQQQNMALENASSEQILAWGLTTSARKMANVLAPGTPRETILDAVRLNWQLWTIIQVEQSEPDCKTPSAIREALLNLAKFVDKRTLDLLVKPIPETIEVLIGINRNIAAGLLGTDLTPEQKAERDRQMAAARGISA